MHPLINTALFDSVTLNTIRYSAKRKNKHIPEKFETRSGGGEAFFPMQLVLRYWSRQDVGDGSAGWARDGITRQACRGTSCMGKKAFALETDAWLFHSLPVRGEYG